MFALSLPAWAQSPHESVLELERFVVKGTRAHASEAEPQDLLQVHDSADIENSGAFSVSEFLDTLPPGIGGNQQLVLIDGMPAYLDISALTPAMVEAIEVSASGAMPKYGAYTNGRVVNIRLKQNYDGREISLEAGGSFHGDAFTRDVMVSGGSFRGKWRAMYSLRHSVTDAVTADARRFSRNQDHRSLGGRDFRLPWGYPATVQAASGSLSGISDARGNPVASALVPAGSVGALAPADFLPGDQREASGLRYFNTSAYLYLTTPSQRVATNFQLSRAVSPSLILSLTVAYSASTSTQMGPPPSTPASEAALVPAAYNPFGQDVYVGLVHQEFGPVVQTASSDNTQFGVGMSGRLPKDWNWNARIGQSLSDSHRETRDLDPDKLTTALASPDPLTRFNPFADASINPVHAALIPDLVILRVQDSRSTGTQFGAQSYGPLTQGWGAGAPRLSLNANGSLQENAQAYRNIRGLTADLTTYQDSRYSLDGTAEIPIAEKKTALYRLDGQLNVSYAAADNGSINQRAGLGLTWAPLRAVTLRASFSESLSSSGELKELNALVTTETLVDPRRTPATAENVQVVTHRNVTTRDATSTQSQLAVTLEPVSLKGLRLTVSYTESAQNHAAGSAFQPQDVIDNEALLAGRVIRADPSASDLELGQPGPIVTVDATAAALAVQSRDTVDLSIDYQLNGPALGRLSFSASAQQVLASRYELESGEAFRSATTGDSNPPNWTGQGRVQWSRDVWSASCQLRYTGASRNDTTPAATDLSMNVGYRFRKPVLARFGKGLQVRLSIQNLLTDEPRFEDTLLGYRGGSAIGTRAEISARLPL